MPPTDLTTSAEAEELRRRLRDLAAVSALPAARPDFNPSRIAEDLVGTLRESLGLDFVYLRAPGRPAEPPLEIAHAGAQPGREAPAAAIGRSLASRLRGRAFASFTARHPLRDGDVRVAVVPIGPGGDLGVLAAGCRRGDFPTETERLFLDVGAHQAAAVFRRARDEEALRDSEQRFARFAQHLPGLAWIKDLAGRYVYANDAAVAAFRTPREEVYGKTDEELFPPETAAQFRHNDRQALAGPGVRTVETLEHEDGVVHHSVVSKFPIPGPDGRPALLGGMAIDVTDRLQAEQALRESEQRFRQLAENIEEVFWMSDLHKNEMLYVSPAYETVWGRTCQSLYEHPRSFLDAIHPDDRSHVETASLARQAQGEAIDVDYRVVRPDGSVRWIRDRGFPIRDAAGRAYRIVGIAEDVTDRKRVEQALRFLSDASAALAGAADGESGLREVARLAVPFFADWCVVDLAEPDGSLRRLAVTHSDPARVRLVEELGRRYPPDPAAPRGPYRVLRTGESQLAAEVADADLTAAARDAEHLRILRDLRPTSYMCVPLRARGRTLGAVSFATAESGRRYAEGDLAFAEELGRRAAIAVENARLTAELRQADRLKDEFLAMLSHELRNPLAPVRNALHIMRSPAANEEAVTRVRETAERQVRHMARLLDDLLDVSRISRGRIELRQEVVDLAALLARAVEAVQPLIDERRHRVIVTPPPEPLRVQGDPMRLEQIVTNLLHNAVKFTDPGGKAWVTAVREGREAVLRVRDSGVGIAPEMLPRVFDLFVQADRQLDRSQGGLGVGLTLVRKLVELHGGTVEGRSAGLGRGSEFVVRLPAVEGEPAGREAGPEGRAADAPALPTRRILVVDDNRDAADTFALFLRMEGQEVRVAYDGPTALRAAQAFRPQTVLLDLGMPGMDGFEVARRLRAQGGSERPLLVALTGWGQDEDRRRSSEAGFDHHLVKPIEPGELRQLLAQMG